MRCKVIGADTPSCAWICRWTVCVWQLSGPRWVSKDLVSEFGNVGFSDKEKNIPHMTWAIEACPGLRHNLGVFLCQ